MYAFNVYIDCFVGNFVKFINILIGMGSNIMWTEWHMVEVMCLTLWLITRKSNELVRRILKMPATGLWNARVDLLDHHRIITYLLRMWRPGKVKNWHKVFVNNSYLQTIWTIKLVLTSMHMRRWRSLHYGHMRRIIMTKSEKWKESTDDVR